MSSQLVNAPVDLILEVCKHLAPEDLFSFFATCRSLSELGLDDTIWRQTPSDVPLDLPVGKSVKDFSGQDLRRLFLKATALNQQWKSGSFNPIKTGQALYPSCFLGNAQMLSSEWLLTEDMPANQDGHYTLWSIKDLDVIHPVCSMSTGTPHTTQHLSAYCTCFNDQVCLWLINADSKRCFGAKLPAFGSVLLVPLVHISPELDFIVLVAGHDSTDGQEAGHSVRIYSLPAVVTEKSGSTIIGDAHSVPPVENLELVSISAYVSPHFNPPPADGLSYPFHVAMNGPNIISIMQPLRDSTIAWFTQLELGHSINVIESRMIPEGYSLLNKSAISLSKCGMFFNGYGEGGELGICRFANGLVEYLQILDRQSIDWLIYHEASGRLFAATRGPLGRRIFIFQFI